MKRFDLLAVSGIFGSSIILASLLVFATAYKSPAQAITATVSTAATKAVPAPPMQMSMVIATPDMLKSDVGPAYIPANPTLPANADVTITITNFDDATALTSGTEHYATASGIVGPLQVATIDPAKPNAPAAVTSTTSLDPATGVSHTFTIPKLGVNVPIAPKSRTTFTIHTAAAGIYTWQCFDPCGSDPNGWGGAMATDGYMKGAMTLCGAGSCGAAGGGCC